MDKKAPQKWQCIIPGCNQRGHLHHNREGHTINKRILERKYVKN
jgi:hypothetical protein